MIKWHTDRPIAHRTDKQTESSRLIDGERMDQWTEKRGRDKSRLSSCTGWGGGGGGGALTRPQWTRPKGRKRRECSSGRPTREGESLWRTRSGSELPAPPDTTMQRLKTEKNKPNTTVTLF